MGHDTRKTSEGPGGAHVGFPERVDTEERQRQKETRGMEREGGRRERKLREGVRGRKGGGTESK